MIAGVLVAQLLAGRAPPDADLVVRGRRDSSAAGSTVFQADTARAMPATQNDALRVVMSAPGVGRASFDNGQLILWGAPASSSRVYIDGVPVPALFHGGGARGVIHDAFVDSIEIVPGGFGVEYGHATGGVVLLRSRTPEGGHASRLSTDFIDSSAVTTYHSDGLSVSGGVRMGYLGDLVRAVAGGAVSSYLALSHSFDYQTRADYHTASGTQLTAFVFGSIDRLDLAPPGDDPVRARVRNRADSFHRIVFRAQTHERGDNASIEVTGWLGLDDHTRRDTVGPFASEARHATSLAGLRASYVAPLAPWLRLRVGIDAEAGLHTLSRLGSLAVPPREGDPFVFGQIPPDDTRSDAWSVRSVSVSPWVELPIAMLGNKLLISPGMRIDATLVEVSRASPPIGDTLPRGRAQVLVAPQPRIAVRINATPALALTASYGLFAMSPDPEDLSVVFGNPMLKGSLAQHATVGIAAHAFDAWSVSATGFARHTDSLAVRPADIPVAGAALRNSGNADSFGVQLVLRCAPWRGWSGWVAYTLSRSTVVDPADPNGRLADTDQTHLFSAVARYALPLGFSVGSRVRVASGAPRTPVIGHALDATTGDPQPLFGATNTDRLPTYLGIDLRADWQGRVARTGVSVWIDLLNVTGQASVEDVLYDPTYRERRYLTGVPFFADAGARVEF